MSAAALAGVFTGIGSLPGIDPLESARLVVGECPALPALPELPERGAGADMIGRTAVLLEGFPIATVPSGWQITDRPGLDHRRALSWLMQDLDAFEEACVGHQGCVKIQITGPWTLAARLERASGHALLRDYGARRDLVECLAQGVSAHVADVARRMPAGTHIGVQIDEPMLDRVLIGAIPTASGWGTYRSIDRAEARAGLASIVTSITNSNAIAMVHSCSEQPPLELFVEAGFTAMSFDFSTVKRSTMDLLGEIVESGHALFLGVVPSVDRVRDNDARIKPADVSPVMTTVSKVHRLWEALGFTDRPPAETISLTPTCGLAGASPQHVRQSFTNLKNVMLALQEDPDGDHS